MYNSQIKNNGSYSVVLPFVFYHGEKKWILGEYFLNQFSLSQEEQILKDFIPNFRIDLFDLSGVDLKKKLERITLRVVLGVVQRIRDGELDFIAHLPALFSVLVNIEDESKRVEILKKLLLYIYWVRDFKPSTLREVLHTAKLEQYEELTMTTAEQLIAEGIQKGIEKEKLEAASKMFDEGIKIEVILRVTGLTENDLKNHGFL
nr:Rpn family recombination-promoting nuclease/putative transposase [Leptospira alstonii]